MKSLKLPQEELSRMRLFYESELQATLSRLEHIKNVLDQLDGSTSSIQINVQAGPTSSNATAEAVASDETSVETQTPTRKYKKRPGPKSVWGNFIVKRLRQVNRPTTYDDMIEDAIAFMKIPYHRRKNARQSIVNSAFRLRNVHKKIDTVGKKGQRGKFLVLKNWLDEQGKLKTEYARMLK